MKGIKTNTLKITRVYKGNLHKLYNSLKGNLYYRFPKINKTHYSLLDGFSELEVLTAMKNGGKFIYVEGPAREYVKLYKQKVLDC